MWLAEKNIAENYIQTVEKCLNSEEIFSKFKSEPSYNQIVGMSSVWQAEIWIKDICENHPEVIDLLPKLIKNDTYGSPTAWAYENDIVMSPNTARYINSALQIKSHFKFLDRINVTELGIGYGGLCYIINCLFDVNSYGLIDLPPVQNFARKYLNQLEISNVQFVQPEYNDLFISEFCLSEFDDEQLYNYYDNHVIISKHIFLQMNLHEEERKTKFLKRVTSDFDCIIRDEFPKTRWPNYVILGTRK
jgi:hypothetical protein